MRATSATVNVLGGSFPPNLSKAVPSPPSTTSTPSFPLTMFSTTTTPPPALQPRSPSFAHSSFSPSGVTLLNPPDEILPMASYRSYKPGQSET